MMCDKTALWLLIHQSKLACFPNGFFSSVIGIFREHGEPFLRQDARCISDSIKEITYLRLANPGFISISSHLVFVSFRLNFCTMGQL